MLISLVLLRFLCKQHPGNPDPFESPRPEGPWEQRLEVVHMVDIWTQHKIATRFHLGLRSCELMLAFKSHVEIGKEESSFNLSDYPDMNVRAYAKQLVKEYKEEPSSYGECMKLLAMELDVAAKALQVDLLHCKFKKVDCNELQSKMTALLHEWKEKIGYAHEGPFIKDLMKIMETAILSDPRQEPPSAIPVLSQAIAVTPTPLPFVPTTTERVEGFFAAQHAVNDTEVAIKQGRKKPSELGDGMLPESQYR